MPETEKRSVVDTTEGMFSNIPVIPPEVLERWFRSEESREWETMEAAATRAQDIQDI